MGGHKFDPGRMQEFRRTVGPGSDAPVNPDRKEFTWNAFFIMALLPSFASTVLSSTVSMLRENAAIQSINKRLKRRTMSFPEMYWPVPMRAIGAQNLLTMPGGVSTAGYLHKKGGSQFSLMKWPLRYIIIHKGCMYYFKSSTSASPQGAFSLNGYNRVMRAAEETTSSNVFPFKIVHFSKKHRTWYFSAASEDERRKWMRYLRREIDHYNDRKETHISSDSDSDADFYGTIERPMEIKHRVDTAEDDYVDEDDDEDEEPDYLKPDVSETQTSTGRPTGPPPSYPPPPVPQAAPHCRDLTPDVHKGPLPPVPIPHRNPISPLPKKHSIPHQTLQKEPSKGPAPPLPFAPHLQKAPSPTPLPALPPTSMKTGQSRATSLGGSGNDRRVPHSSVQIHLPATLPICDQLHSRMVLNGPSHSSPSTASTLSLGNHCLRSRPSVPLPHAEASSLSVNEILQSLPSKPPASPLLKPGLNKLTIPKPPPPTAKPPLPSDKLRTPFQRASPDGQSFRSLVEEVPTGGRKKTKLSKNANDSDDDYENVQLPDSVFIDSTETAFVEKLFRECCANPPDGLYGIRNSGTKTAQVLVVWDVGINKARNYRLFEEDGSVFLESDLTFPNLPALIEHYYSHPLPHHGSLCLQKPYAKILSS